LPRLKKWRFLQRCLGSIAYLDGVRGGAGALACAAALIVTLSCGIALFGLACFGATSTLEGFSACATCWLL
jgi:hypothetical protein